MQINNYLVNILVTVVNRKRRDPEFSEQTITHSQRATELIRLDQRLDTIAIPIGVAGINLIAVQIGPKGLCDSCGPKRNQTNLQLILLTVYQISCPTKIQARAIKGAAGRGNFHRLHTQSARLLTGCNVNGFILLCG